VLQTVLSDVFQFAEFISSKSSRRVIKWFSYNDTSSYSSKAVTRQATGRHRTSSRLLLYRESWDLSLTFRYALGRYRVYQKECPDFRHLHLRNENRYDDIGTCILLVYSHSFTDTAVVNGHQLWLRDWRDQYSIYREVPKFFLVCPVVVMALSWEETALEAKTWMEEIYWIQFWNESRKNWYGLNWLNLWWRWRNFG
jgi:hypothetical protein